MLPLQNFVLRGFNLPLSPARKSGQAYTVPVYSRQDVLSVSTSNADIVLSQIFSRVMFPTKASFGLNPPPTLSCSCPSTSTPSPAEEVRVQPVWLIYISGLGTPTTGTDIYPKMGTVPIWDWDPESESVQCEHSTWYKCTPREFPPNPSPALQRTITVERPLKGQVYSCILKKEII